MRITLRLPHPLAPGLPRMVSASVAFHITLAVTALVLPGLLPRPSAPTWDDVIPGLIVDMPSGGPAPAAAEPEPEGAPAAPEPEPEPEPPPPPPEPPEKKPAPKPKPKPRDPEPAKPEARPATRPPAEASGDKPSGTGTASDAAGAGGEGIGLSFGDGRTTGYGGYPALVVGKLKRHWSKPVNQGTEPLSARVQFILRLDGTVADVRVIQSSGFLEMDMSAMRAVRDASPFPKPPSGVIDDLQVAITFTLEPSGL